jgi:hypothetical protein
VADPKHGREDAANDSRSGGTVEDLADFNVTAACAGISDLTTGPASRCSARAVPRTASRPARRMRAARRSFAGLAGFRDASRLRR